MRALAVLPGVCLRQREAACRTKLLLLFSFLASAQAKSAGRNMPGDVLVDLKVDPARIGFDVELR